MTTRPNPRVSIVTLHRVHNFGSALQTYATQELLRANGLDAEIVDYRRPSEHVGFRAQLKHNYARWNRNVVVRSAFWALRSRDLRRQEENFDDFISRRVELSTRSYLSAEELEADPPTADFYCVGSDQVWNNDYHVAGSERPFYLTFAPEGAPRFSLASSFGKAKLSEKDALNTRSALSSFRAISVREGSGVAILKELGLASTHVVDPTLGHRASFWDSIAVEPSLQTDYILHYQLHRGHDLSAVVKEIQGRTGLPVVSVTGYWNPRKGLARSLHDTSVEEFVGLLRNAAHVVTDSFHGTAFSLNTGRAFTAVMPPKYSERISSLLELTGTSSRGHRLGIDESLDLEEIDWMKVEQRLDMQRAVISEFIRSSVES